MSLSRASRELPEPARVLARRFVAAVVETAAEKGLLEGSRPLRVRGTTRSGGLRVDGGEGGLRERTISLIDLGWVLLADQAAKSDMPTEAEVNAARYLPGTPRRSTRWVDTGIGLALLAWAKENEGWDTPPPGS